MAKRRLASSGLATSGMIYHIKEPQRLNPAIIILQMLTALAEKPPASAGYRGSDLVHWRKAAVSAGAGRFFGCWMKSRHIADVVVCLVL